ncbi:hypothetical protein [Agrobacterium vitis]|uniref:hypothetical protein n=1 Tax=Agrobacterium vitis TaxID=373 RepID=UPI003D2B9AC4
MTPTTALAVVLEIASSGHAMRDSQNLINTALRPQCGNKTSPPQVIYQINTFYCELEFYIRQSLLYQKWEENREIIIGRHTPRVAAL